MHFEFKMENATLDGRAAPALPSPVMKNRSGPGNAPDSLLIEHENLDDKVYARIKDMIAGGGLSPGQRIVQEDLARDMGVSRTPLVNALKRLAQERLLEWLPRRGIYVRSLTLHELLQVFEVRQSLEPLAARLAATRITPDEVDALDARCRALATLPDSPETMREIIECDRLFHWRLVELADNPHLTAAMEPVSLLTSAYVHGLRRSLLDIISEHLKILSALRRGDAQASEEAMRWHMLRSSEKLRREAEEAAGTGLRNTP